MKKYLRTFIGNSENVKLRRLTLTMAALVFSLFISILNAKGGGILENKILETIVDFFLGLASAVVLDLTLGLGRPSPLLSKDKRILLTYSSLPLVSDSLTYEQIKNGLKFYSKHKEHVDKICKETDVACDICNEDKNDPRLWKPSHWNWFLNF